MVLKWSCYQLSQPCLLTPTPSVILVFIMWECFSKVFQLYHSFTTLFKPVWTYIIGSCELSFNSNLEIKFLWNLWFDCKESNHPIWSWWDESSSIFLLYLYVCFMNILLCKYQWYYIEESIHTSLLSIQRDKYETLFASVSEPGFHGTLGFTWRLWVPMEVLWDFWGDYGYTFFIFLKNITNCI